MSLTQALATSLSGLHVTQSSLAVVAGNVANAQTPGYIAQTAVQVAVSSGDAGDSVRISAINRLLDKFVQQQLRTETSGGGYADVRANLYEQLLQVYGQPSSGTAFDTVFNNFTSAIQALTTSPNSAAAQGEALGTAQLLAAQLNRASSNIQLLRSEADQGIANDVQTANNALQQIAKINQQLASGGAGDKTAASLENERDQYIDQLSKIIDIRIVHSDSDQDLIFTSSGTQLVGTQASQLAFNPAGTITPAQQWNSDPTKSSLGTITLVSPAGGSVDLVANGSIRSGELAAYLNMRDKVLVQAQSQLDQIAAQMSKALSDTTTDGTPTTVGPQNGFSVDMAGLLGGNTINITYTDGSSVQHNITVVRVDDPSVLPLSNTVTPDPNDTVIGIDFSGGPASVVTQLTTALGATGLQFSNPSGTTLNVLDNGPATITVDNVSTTATATSLTGGSGQLPLFVDGTAPFTGSITAAGYESVGFAARIAVNSTLIADPTKLVTYQTSPATPVGDATRPNFIYNQLVNASFEFSPSAGIGGTAAPFQGTLSAYISQIVSTQSLTANAASNLKQGQDVVVNSLQARFNDTSAVNIDNEMARLITLQTTYGANARVMSTVKQMLDALLQTV
jgi:flagellar hook-associated protein 1